MIKSIIFIVIISFLTACNHQEEENLNQELLSSLGSKYKTEFGELVKVYETEIAEDSTNVEAFLGLAESNILLYVFGYVQRAAAVNNAKEAYQKAKELDSLDSDVIKLSGVISFLDWNWHDSQVAFVSAIKTNPQNLNARHWYALWLSAMGRFDEAMAQSDTILTMDTAHNYLISRASFLYFQSRFEEMKPLMLEEIAKNPEVPWAYDWLGMAYNGLIEHEDALKTYFKAFELSDGTVEVGAGLGHALGNAGEHDLAKEMADYYAIAAQTRYLPPVQRSFIHIGIGEYNEAIRLLEQAYTEKSWFLIFIQSEHWYDPIRDDSRFQNIINHMEFPE